MARIRTVKPEFFVHEALFDAEIECALPLRLAFAGLWTQADREGRFRWRPRALKTGILPYDEVDFAGVLEALEKYGFVRSYEADGKRYGFIPSWRRHQHINQREADSVIPAPGACAHVPAHGEKEKEGSQAGASALFSGGSGEGVPSPAAAGAANDYSSSHSPPRHGRACPGHPRAALPRSNSWMAGTSAGHDEGGVEAPTQISGSSPVAGHDDREAERPGKSGNGEGEGAPKSTVTLGHEGPRSHTAAAKAEIAERAASPPGRRGHGMDTRGGPGHDGLPIKNADRAKPVPAGQISKAPVPGGQVPTASQWIYAKARELLALSERSHKNPGAIIGKWLRDHGEARLLEALRVAEIKRSPEPVALIEGVLRRTSANDSRGRGANGSGDMFGGLRISELGESDG